MADLDKTVQEVTPVDTERASELRLAALAEKEILEEYLPKQLSEEEVQKLVNDAIAKHGASSVKDMGAVMGTMTKQVGGGRFDPRKLSQMVKESLTKSKQ